MEQEQTPSHSDRLNALAAELAATRRALYALVESLVWAGVATPLLAVIVLSHLPGGPRWSTVFDASHALLSGVVALVVLRLSRRLFGPLLRGTLVHYGIALLVAGMVGASIEVTQKFTHGDPSLRDLVRDMLGAMAALAGAASFAPSRNERPRPWVRWALRLGAIAILFRVAFPAIRVEYQRHERAARFPQLADFDSAAEGLFVYAELGATLTPVAPPTAFSLAKGRAGRVTFPGGEEYPKLEIDMVGDWSKARRLAFDVYSDAPSLVPLRVRIDDHGDRHFNGTLMIPQGQSTQSISVEDIETADGNKLDLARMKAILLFIRAPTETTVLTFDSVRLEP